MAKGISLMVSFLSFGWDCCSKGVPNIKKVTDPIQRKAAL
jgi:hypothetical protein